MSQPDASEPHRSRLAALRSRIDAAELDGLLVSYPADQYYLTGAVLEDSAVLVTPRQAVVITDSRFDEQVALQAPWAARHVRPGSVSLPTAVIATVAEQKKVRRLGVDEHLTLGQFDPLRRKARRAKLKLVLTRNLVSAGRVVKDDGELAMIQRAIRAAEAAFAEVRRIIKPLMREREAAAELEYQMRLAGAAGASFEPIVAVGPRSSLPHARAGETRLRADQPILFDWGARVGGYCSDLTRVIHFGKWPRRIAHIYPIVLEAQQAGIAAVRACARCTDVDAAARRVIERAGFGPRFGHGLGHGIGLAIHESPRLSIKTHDVLAPGMVVTVEPGIYLPGVGGVRIEDDVLVTPTGCRVLSRLDKSMS